MVSYSDEQIKQSFLALTTLAGDRSVLTKAKEVLAAYPESTAALNDLVVIADHVEQCFPQVTLYFDLGELRGYHYHTGPVFSAYVPGKGQAIANGGRYDQVGEVFGRARPATGFSTDLIQLIKTLPALEPARLVFAPVAQDFDSAVKASLKQAIAELRAQGVRVIEALPGQTQTASDMGATEQLVLNNSSWQTESL